jgi:TRAP-type C4-dicarboxylate transport system permease small subunit
MLSSQKSRFLIIAILLTILAVLLVWAGTIGPNPATNNYPGTEDIHENPSQYVGEHVTVSGTVTNTDPLTLEAETTDTTLTFVIENTDHDVAVDDRLTVFGTLQADNNVDASNTVRQKPWERYYMYAVSFIAGLLVLGRLLNRWTIDTTTWSIVPRPDPLLTITN